MSNHLNGLGVRPCIRFTMVPVIFRRNMPPYPCCFASMMWSLPRARQKPSAASSALSLMRKNENPHSGVREMEEDVLQLLLSRGLWDCYHYNADEFVEDFVSLSDVVTRERLAALGASLQGKRRLQPPIPRLLLPMRQRKLPQQPLLSTFLGRLWSVSTPRLTSFAPALQSGANSPSTTTSTTTTTTATTPTTTTSGSTLSPGIAAVSRPLSMLRRSASKHSIASTLNSMEAASSTTSSAAAS